MVRDAVAAFLSAHGSPFTAVADAPGSNKLEAAGPEAGKWLLADSLAEPLALFASRTGEDEANVRGGAGGCACLPDCVCARLGWVRPCLPGCFVRGCEGVGWCCYRLQVDTSCTAHTIVSVRASQHAAGS